MIKRYLGFFIIIFVAMILAVIGLLSSETGSRWLLQRAFSAVPNARITAKIEGRLLDHIALTDLSYQSTNEQIHINTLDLQWQPSQLFSRTLKINQLSIDGVTINIIDNKELSETKIDLTKGFKLPIKPNIDKLVVSNVLFQHGQLKHHIDNLQLSTESHDERINLLSFNVNADLGYVKAKGFVSSAENFPMAINLTWQVNLDNQGVWQGNTKVNGDMVKLTIENRLSAPFTLTLQGNTENLLTKPSVNLTGEWRHLNWPLATALPQIQSPQGRFTIQGLLSDYNIKLKSEFSQRHLPQAWLSFDGNGNQDSLQINKLDVTSDSGLFKLMGRFSWSDVPSFDLTAKGENFNPALFVPELPGDLTFNSRIQGKIGTKVTQINADINQVNGQLRQQPFHANGNLKLTGEQVKINELKIDSGINHLWLNGTIDKAKGNLEVDIDMPKLTTLWPTLAGKLKGGGRIHGGWEKPSINFTVTGNNLKFAEHSANEVNLDVAFFADERKTSIINLSSKAISSGNTEISSLTLNGKGSLKQHDINIDLISPKGNLSTALTGSWHNPTWQAQLSKLNLAEQNGKLWSLAKNVPIKIENKHPLGIQAAIDETCLVQQLAALCSKAFLAANGDLNVALTAKSLPSDLFQPFLPKNTKITTALNGGIDAQRKNNLLTGSYNFTTLPTLIAITGKEGAKEFHLQSSAFSGNIKNDAVLANLDLKLAASDYLRAQLLLNTGKAQTISGNISSTIKDFTPLQAFLPQINDIQGQLSTDLKVSGTIKQPQINGFINFSDGLVKSGRLALQNLNFQGNVNAAQGNHIQLQGSVIPVILNPANKAETVNLKSGVNFTADLKQHPALVGEFKLLVPSTTVSINRKGAVNTIVLGNSSLSGHVLNNTLFTDLDISLLAQDYLRGKLQMGLKSQALSGQIEASIKDLKFLETLFPELSHVKGSLTADLSASGTSTSPKLTGNLHFNDGAVEVDDLGISINQIELHATTPVLTENTIQLSGSAKSGEGIVKLNGSLDIDPEQHWPVTLTLTGKDFEVAKLPEAQIAVSPDLIIATSNEQTKITGDIAIPKAILKIQDIPENAVKVSPDEIILGEEPPEKLSGRTPTLTADINVSLGKQVSFSGQGLTTDLNGNLRIIKTADNTAMQGSVNMANATYKSYGQNLTVRKGQFAFNGPVDNPWLDVEAIRLSKSKKVTAILALSGQLDNPQTRISSEPSLPESEALAYLITGGPLNQVSQSDSNILASAALSYGTDQAGWLANELGLSEFGMQQGNTLKDTLLVMGKYLTPDFYMGAKVGMFNKQAVLVLKHKVFNNFNVETQAGTSQRIKLNYEFDGD